MNRPIRLALPLLLLAATLTPLAGHAAEQDDPCHVMDDAPAYMCSGAGTYRTVTTFARGRGFTMILFAFEFTGPLVPAGTTQRTGACVAIVRNRGLTEACNLPFEVAFDPLLESATVTGTVRTKSLGTISLNLTANAIEETQAASGVITDVNAACNDLTGETAAGSIYRHGEANGTAKAGKTAMRFRNTESHLSQYASAGGHTIVSLPCAPERAEDDGFFFLLNCIALSVDTAAYTAACNSSEQEKTVSVTAKTRATTVRVTAVERRALGPDVPDPSWISPASLVPGPQVDLCVTIRTRGAISIMCGGESEVEMDPLLRTTRIKGEIGGWDHHYDGPPFFGPPGLPDRYGRITIDLTATVGDEGMQPSGRSRTLAFATCEYLIGAQINSVIQGDGTAVGTVAFQRTLGTFRGTDSRPLPAAMDWRQLTLAGGFVFSAACPSQEQH